jgi:hypothetical protein
MLEGCFRQVKELGGIVVGENKNKEQTFRFPKTVKIRCICNVFYGFGNKSIKFYCELFDLWRISFKKSLKLPLLLGSNYESYENHLHRSSWQILLG